MFDKESLSLVAQAIYDDILLTFVSQGPLKHYLTHSAAELHKLYFVCRFPSVICTAQSHRNLSVIGEDELTCIVNALSGTQPVSVVLFQVQGFVQENIVQLYHKTGNLRQVYLFHECFVNATSVDLTVAVCASLRRHLSRIHVVSKYKNFQIVQNRQMKEVVKKTILLCWILRITQEVSKSSLRALNTQKLGYAAQQFYSYLQDP